MLETLKSIENVERTAQALREKYGPQAEAWCDDALRTVAQKDPRRNALRELRRALRWL